MSKKYVELLFFCLSFIGLFVFFFIVHPLVPFDGDDWSYLSYFRQGYPLWGGWNPSKVLPEVVMPLCGWLSAYIFRPLLGDYISAITCCSSLILSLMIMMYSRFFYKLIEKKFELPFAECLMIAFFFLACHFVVFASKKINTTYLFASVNLTCYYYYVLPALVNATLVLYLYTFNNFLVEVNIRKNGFLVLVVYLAIFSNIFHSVILSTFIFVQLLHSYLEETNKIVDYHNVRDFVQKNVSWFVILFIWLISLIFEANGGRANQIGHGLLSLPIKATLASLGILLKQTYKGFYIILLVVFCLAGIGFIKCKNKQSEDLMYRISIIKFAICLVSVLLYEILVCAKAFPTYIAQGNVAFSFLFYLFLMLCFSLSFLLHKYPKVLSILPLFCFVVGVFTFNSNIRYKESNIPNLAPYKCVLVDKDLIEQIVKADRDGNKEMILTVPKSNTKDNWPHPNYMGSNISRTLYKHGIISQNIKITIKPDIKMNLKYRLGY